MLSVLFYVLKEMEFGIFPRSGLEFIIKTKLEFKPIGA
ncbi:hypothetical protein SAMN05444366_3065 [Flavobacterium saccharophilum]|uniref:Uncharacterized protein n=1 Tax=Flavobacterium saccharophilum TaxID=29534 RepID=A0A1M7I8S5_9FLAO|nr:hypothetical protein SAMN05444366_3065 [Flavobacterium saccharophilum]